MKKNFVKNYKRSVQEQENRELLNKKSEAFLERFKQMSPAEQKKCLKKLNYELGLIDAKIKDAQSNMPSYHSIRLTEGQQTIIVIASAIVGGPSLGGLIGTLTKDPGLGVYIGIMGTVLGGIFGEQINRLSKDGFFDQFVDFFRDLKSKRLNKKIIKHKAKQLKLAKRLELIKSAQHQEDELMLN